MSYLEEKGMEVEKRDLYMMNFDPVLSANDFYYAKDGEGEPIEALRKNRIWLRRLITSSLFIQTGMILKLPSSSVIMKRYPQRNLLIRMELMV